MVSYGKKAPAGSRVFISKRSMYLRPYYRRGSRKDSERGPLTFAWKMKTCGGVCVCVGGIAKVINSY